MTENEFRTGVMADGARLMQPPSDFITDAKRTLSPAWHGDKVALAQLKGRINGAIDALNKLDALKKTLFYGRDNNLIAEGQGNSIGLAECMPMPVGADAVNVFHAILGKATEAGELLEALRECYNGNEVFDRVNAIEEVGDGFWYDAILLDEMGSDFADAQARVIAKLRARFPDKFEAEQANVRDLENERRILEQRNGIEGDEQELHALSMGIGEPILDLDAAVLSDPLRHVELEPSKPASGPQAVLAAEVKADAAFDAVKAAGVPSVDVSEPLPVYSDLAKGIGEREARMPGEHNFDKK